MAKRYGVVAAGYTRGELNKMRQRSLKVSRMFAGKAYVLYTTGTKSKCKRIGEKRKAEIGSLYKVVKTPSSQGDRYAVYTRTR